VLTAERVTELFKEYLPDHIAIRFQPASEYVDDALLNPFVMFQVTLGIYELDTVREEFLGVAKSVVIFDEVVVCLDLINNHVGALPVSLQEGYVRHVAAHEAHHFEHGHGLASSDLLEQAHREQDCNNLVAERYPELEQLWQQVEQQSPTIQRVYERIRCIQEASRV
jgi:hypothetical protein